MKPVFESQDSLKTGEYEKALIDTFIKIDAEIKPLPYSHNVGTTANVVLITPTHIYCANAGDARAVLKCGSKTVPLSSDHKPFHDGEKARIEKAGY